MSNFSEENENFYLSAFTVIYGLRKTLKNIWEIQCIRHQISTETRHYKEGESASQKWQEQPSRQFLPWSAPH